MVGRLFPFWVSAYFQGRLLLFSGMVSTSLYGIFAIHPQCFDTRSPTEGSTSRRVKLSERAVGCGWVGGLAVEGAGAEGKKGNDAKMLQGGPRQQL